MRHAVSIVFTVLLVANAQADEVLDRFNHKYRDFLSRDSQALLPLPTLSKIEWKKVQETSSLNILFVDPDRFYNNKTYTFTLYQVTDGGQYYLDAKGGFWGMDELIYGPLDAAALQ